VNILNIMGIVVVMMFLGVMMPSLLTAQGLLITSLTGYPVEQLAAGMLVLIVIIAFIIYIFNQSQPSAPAPVY
jgi:hypothetical protein